MMSYVAMHIQLSRISFAFSNLSEPMTFLTLRYPRAKLGFLVLALGAICPLADAADCAAIDDDLLRLACYDKNAGRKLEPKAAPSASADSVAKPTATSVATDTAARNLGVIVDRRAEADSKRRRTLADSWDLDPANGRPPFELRSYKPMYLLATTYTNNTNRQPTSGRDENSLGSPIDLKSTEAQFQISFKTKLWDNIFRDNGSLWAGYTQSSRWQIYNSKLSRPFRETDYEPEAMFVLRTPYEIAGWQARMTSLAVTHQSNGRALPLSRSWNRVIAQFGFEKDDWLLLVRPWWRIPENRADDDNPGIENYVGRGELIVARRYGGQTFSLQARHSLRGGEKSRGSVKLEWSLPLSGHLKAHLSLFSGYGESLIDFNHRQTLIGAGISLVEWQ
jgi:phospholipase A1/A2